MNTDTSTPLMEVRGLRCERDGRVLFEDLSFSVARGEIVRVNGPNGSGKTTLLRSLAGLSGRCRGHILWRGAPLPQIRYPFFAESLYIGHEPGIKTNLSAVENLRWHCALCARDQAHGIESALSRMGLSAGVDAPTRQLSAGQRRRVGLTRLLLGSAILWILDEPFTAIDTNGVTLVETLIADFADAGGAVILTTHHPLNLDRPIGLINLGQPGVQA